MTLTPKIWFVRIVELGFLPTDDADLRLKKVTLTLVPLIIGPVAFIWGSIYFLLGHILSGSIPMSYSIISAVGLNYFFKTKKIEFLQFSQLSMVLLLPFLLMWTLGGFAASSMVMIWAIFSPVATLMFLKKRSALKWFLIYLVLILISVLIDDDVAAAVTPLPNLAQNFFYFLNMGCGSAGLYLLVSYAFSEEKRATEADLRIAATAFESQECLMITDAEGVILRVNQAFTESTGYTPEELIGRTPRLLKSGRHDDDFYREMWETLYRTGNWQGEIWDRRKNGEIYPKLLSISAVKNTHGVVTNYVGSHTDITQKKLSEELIWKQANLDELTGLPNRNMFRDHLNTEITRTSRAKSGIALLLVDLDNFKDVNDTLGHDIGDILLKEAALRIRACVRESDMVSRLGGDEFTVIITEVPDTAHIEDLAQKVINQLSHPYVLDTETAHVSASIGISLYPTDAADYETLMKCADQAMYAAKNQGRNCYSYFTQAMQKESQSRMQLGNELRLALARQEFVLHYQPQINLETGRVTGMEALVRWQHPTKALVPPGIFIPIAESTGLILPLGE